MSPTSGAPGGAAGRAGGGGLSLLYAGEQVNQALSGALLAGVTDLVLGNTADLIVDRPLLVGGEIHPVDAIDEATHTVTVAAPGLVTNKAAGTGVSQAPMLGSADILQLPGGPHAELDIRLVYNLPQFNGNPSFYNGRSVGTYRRSGGMESSWLQTLANYGSWWANAQHGPAATFSVGLIHATGASLSAWSVEYSPDLAQLSFLALGAESFHPRVYSIIVAGR